MSKDNIDVSQPLQRVGWNLDPFSKNYKGTFNKFSNDNQNYRIFTVSSLFIDV